MPRRMVGIGLTSIERAELVRRATNSPRSRDARRARVILLLAEGATWDEITTSARCSRAFIAKWFERFRRGRIGAMYAEHRGSAPRVMTARLRKRILAALAERTPRGRETWSTRRLAARLGVSHMTVQRVWSDARPPRRKR